MSHRLHVLVEGHGEVDAIGNLLARVAQGLGVWLPWAKPLRWTKLHLREGVERGANFVRSQPGVAGLLVVRDEDDDCPRETGPQVAAWLRELGLPFPSAVVLLKPEYEVLFLPCIAAMAGRALGEGKLARPGLRADAAWEGPWESRRDVKGFLSSQMPAGRSYKPSVDQLPLTRLIDLAALRDAEVPCFGTLERAVRFLSAAGPGEVYPAP